MNIKNLKLIFLSSIIFFTYLSNKSPANQGVFISSDYSLRKINLNLEKLEKSLQVSNFSKACQEAKSTAKLIKDNINAIQEIEPNHNWAEIRLLLLEIPKSYCK